MDPGHPTTAHAIENERQNFRNLFRQTPEMVCILSGPAHRFEFVNEAHIRALGFDATGLTVREAQPESVEVHGILDEVYRTGRTAELHEIPITLTDRLRYFNLTYAARNSEQGTIDGIMILGVEVTDQILARESLRAGESRLKFALANSNMGTWTVRLGTSEVDLSEESCELFGLNDRANRNVAETIGAVIHPDDRLRASEDLQHAITTRGLYLSEYRILRPRDGTERWILATGRAQYDKAGAPTVFSGVIMDITARKRSEEALQTALAARDEFLSIASHELKTPVTSLKLQLQLAQRRLGLADAAAAASPEKFAVAIGSFARQVDRLSVLIDGLLDVSRIEAGRMSYAFEPTDLSELAREVAARFEYAPKAAAPHVELLVPGPVIVQCDRFRIDQVITNLLGNAFKYGEGKPITLTVARVGQGARIMVRDRGIGIAAENQAKIFDRFERAISHRAISGLGLGLYITRQIVEAHGGRATVESTFGEGSTFIVTIPDDPMTAAANQAPLAPEARA